MRIIQRSEVERLLPVEACVDVMRAAMIAVSRGDVSLPIRRFMPVPGAAGKLALMPGSLGTAGEAEDASFGIKLVCKYERPHDDPLGTHVGMVMLFDSAKGVPLAMVEGSSLTAIRTSAASALATDLLARRDAKALAIIGNGEQAMRHVAAMQAVRAIERVRVWGRDAGRARTFAETASARFGLAVEIAPSAAEAVMGADIVCTTTSAKEPVLAGADLEPGSHVNLVGSAIPTTAEIDGAAVARMRFYVDYRPAAMAAAGELLDAIEAGLVSESHILAEIGDVAQDPALGRTSADEITCYKSLGVAAQDLAAAHAVWRLAEAEGAGTVIDLRA
ncbi:ornithine cyclodeaminase family protein [Erythrobacter sp. HL-111]|uniref:ornithine cyclodeaminase family protein n=1 Tax=Erythrobacter sp. HL-111 TaxID=1798193 RepID=UPI0006DB4D39|nr:ornithine cyclodeaminase family protein [Erythrobacter sp. HL-111]KPP96298.1 MAG: ornithine cyclodeaminase Ocd [Erythrobacteraceae bacterium HL-111]SDR74289.1 ornithine cyclodeaminase [Erythrobacter sp. HL-111]